MPKVLWRPGLTDRYTIIHEILPETRGNVYYRKRNKYFLAPFNEFDDFYFTKTGQLSELTNAFYSFLVFLMLPIIFYWTVANKKTRVTQQ